MKPNDFIYAMDRLRHRYEITETMKMNQEEMEKWSRGANSYSEQAINTEQIRSAYKSIFISDNQVS